MAGILEIVRGFIAAVKYEADPLIALAPLRATDEYTFIHSMNICILNLAQAMPLGIEGPLLHDLGIAALLHDVGKFFVPDEILNKPGRLDEAEWKIIRRHPLMGAQYLLGTPGVPHLAVITAFEHHMKYDFTGYPEISGQWQQNLCSQMTAVSDIFDAMRTKRPYKEAMDMDMIKQRMLGLSGIDLHPALTGNLLKILRRFSEVHQDSD
jgi:HD-GYP domain-containing protein (c-di-GMP phosphodiesterase class II)